MYLPPIKNCGLGHYHLFFLTNLYSKKPTNLNYRKVSYDHCPSEILSEQKIDNVLMRQSTARRSCQTFLIDSHQTFLGQWGSVILLEANISRKRAAVNIKCNILTYIQGDFFIGCWGEIPIQKKDVNYCKNNLNQAVMRVHWRQFYSESLTSKFCTQQFRDNLHGL